MSINLAWRSFQDMPPPHPQTVNLDSKGGTLGRATDNQFAIYDPEQFASRHHARIFIDQGAWYVEDTSSAGTLINNEVELFKGQRHLLRHGDILTIGECEVDVKIFQQPHIYAQDPTGAADPLSHHPSNRQQIPGGLFDIDDFFRDDTPPQAPPQAASPTPEAMPLSNLPHMDITDQILPPTNTAAIDDAFDFDHLLSEVPDENQPGHPSAQLPDEPSPNEPSPNEPSFDQQPAQAANEQAANEQAANEQPANEQPANEQPFDEQPVQSADEQPAQLPNEKPLNEKSPNQQSADAQQRQNSHAEQENTVALRAFLSELNIDPQELIGQNKTEVMRVAGVILRTLTRGMMEVLQARSSVKKHFHMDTTQIQSARNNPLKFAATPIEAMTHMLKQEKGYMDPIESAEEAVNDAKAHQMAMISGLDAAIQATIGAFDPRQLEKEFDREPGFSFSKKSKYWQHFHDKFRQIADEAESTSNSQFSEQFRQHYEAQIRQLYADKFNK